MFEFEKIYLGTSAIDSRLLNNEIFSTFYVNVLYFALLRILLNLETDYILLQLVYPF